MKALDLHENTLYGTEWCKSDLLVASIIEGIEAGDTFEPVAVIQYRARENYYSLWRDGHHRAIAHYITGTPLPVYLKRQLVPETQVPIAELELIDDETEHPSPRRKGKQYFYSRFRGNKKFRPPRLNLDHVWSPDGPVYSPISDEEFQRICMKLGLSSPPAQSDA